MNHCLLNDRAVLLVSGEDARDFLQGLVTKDMRRVAPDEAVFAALLSPQGRFLFDFFIVEQDGRFLLDTNKARLPELIKRLTLYRLRSKVHFEAVEAMNIIAAWGADFTPQHDGNAYADPRLPTLGWRILTADLPNGPETLADYKAHRILLGVPEGSEDLTFDRSILLEYGYDELHAVDFDKGCYVGQEVTARSKHRASLRKFIHRVTADTMMPAQGTAVLAGEREAGIITSSAGHRGLAHLRVEEVVRAEHENIPLTAAGAICKAVLPDWCRTAFIH